VGSHPSQKMKGGRVSVGDDRGITVVAAWRRTIAFREEGALMDGGELLQWERLKAMMPS